MFTIILNLRSNPTCSKTKCVGTNKIPKYLIKYQTSLVIYYSLLLLWRVYLNSFLHLLTLLLFQLLSFLIQSTILFSNPVPQQEVLLNLFFQFYQISLKIAPTIFLKFWKSGCTEWVFIIFCFRKWVKRDRNKSLLKTRILITNGFHLFRLSNGNQSLQRSFSRLVCLELFSQQAAVICSSYLGCHGHADQVRSQQTFLGVLLSNQCLEAPGLHQLLVALC